MNRELKFKLWSFKENKMGVVDGLYQGPMCKGVCWEVFTTNSKHSFTKHTNDFVFLQYIGKQDKNGQDIYEGDVIGIPDKRAKGGYRERTVVELSSNSYIDENEDYSDVIGVCWGYALPKEFAKCVVMGNIYENKELLEVQNNEFQF